MELVPQPHHLRIEPGDPVPVGRLALTDLPEPLAVYRASIERLLAQIGQTGPERPVRFAFAGGPPESYRLEVTGEAVTVAAADAHGALHACRTLRDLAGATPGATLPRVQVDDQPTFAVRGLFAESFAGTDRMELPDWQQLVDRLGQLKLNTLGISVYGCWQLGHDGERTEQMFLPLRGFPQLRTPQRLVTWDPRQGAQTELRYLPRMFEADFFGELVGYAAAQGIEVIPQLGGPGHSTLIPRLVPALSARDDAGRPTGYGYCVTRPEALAALAGLVRSLVRQHLAPAGIRRLHVAGDEFYPIRNVDPADLRRVVSPYCRCDGCRRLDPGELLIAYLLQVGRVLAEPSLAESGLSMVNWHDTLVREGVRETYLARMAAEDLPAPVIAWWKYNDPVPTPDTVGAATWVCPTTGLFPLLFGQDLTPNIETALRRGHDAGATGTFAYTLPDPADHANLACFADLSWNLAGSGGANGFWRRWAALTCPADPDRAQHAYSTARTITASYPLMLYLLDHLLPYFATAAAGATTYPDDLLRVFSVPQPGLGEVLRQVRDTLRDAVATMPARCEARVRDWPDPVESWRHQCRRLADSLDLFLAVLAAARAPELDLARVEALIRQGEELMRQVAATTAPYLAPAVLREHWGFVRGIGPALQRLREQGGVAGPESWYAWII